MSADNVKVLVSLWQFVEFIPQVKALEPPLLAVHGIIAISAFLSSEERLASHTSSHTQLIPYQMCNTQRMHHSSNSRLEHKPSLSETDITNRRTQLLSVQLPRRTIPPP